MNDSLRSPAHGGIIECNAVLCHAAATRRLPCGAPVCDEHYDVYMTFTDVLNCCVCDGRSPHCIHSRDSAYQDNTLVTVHCVYGHTYRVLRRQLDDPHCTQLALFTKDGRRYSDLEPGNIARYGGITLHRDNIAEVLGVHHQRLEKGGG
jgi:hypothetical protein